MECKQPTPTENDWPLGDENVTFEELLYAYIIARVEEDDHQPDQLQHRAQRAKGADLGQF